MTVLLYELEHGPAELKVLEQCFKANLPIPARIAAGEDLDADLLLFYSAFTELSSCRNNGDAPIPWVAIKLWCDEFDVQGEQREDLFHIVRLVDLAYLKYLAEKKEAASKKVDRAGKRKGKGRARRN